MFADNFEEVMCALAKERRYQEEKWGDLDDHNHGGDFLIYIQQYLDRAIKRYDYDNHYDTMTELRKVGALCVAAMEKYGVGNMGGRE